MWACKDGANKLKQKQNTKINMIVGVCFSMVSIIFFCLYVVKIRHMIEYQSL